MTPLPRFAALVIGAVLALGAIAPVSAASPVPRVAVIVGPAGSFTAGYRALAERAADVAEKLGAEVVRAYSPDATWPAVRRAATLPLAKAGLDALPRKVQVGVRWDPILLDPAPAVAATAAPDAGPGPAATAAPGENPGREAGPGVSPIPAPAASAAPTPTTSAAPAPAATAASDAVPVEAPPVDLVAPEQLGSVVDVATAERTKGGPAVTVTYPRQPGLYRLVPTLHAPDGTAYDAATQALVASLVVRVTGEAAVAFGVTPNDRLVVGVPSQLAVRVVNTGARRLDQVITAPPSRVAAEPGVVDRLDTVVASLVATWVSTDGRPTPPPVQVVLEAAAAAPGGEAVILLEVIPPGDPGAYLLVIDVVSPALGPLSALGSAPAVVRATVVPPPVEAPTSSAAGQSQSTQPEKH